MVMERLPENGGHGAIGSHDAESTGTTHRLPETKAEAGPQAGVTQAATVASGPGPCGDRSADRPAVALAPSTLDRRDNRPDDAALRRRALANRWSDSHLL